jgi:hypothetical protein
MARLCTVTDGAPRNFFAEEQYKAGMSVYLCFRRYNRLQPALAIGLGTLPSHCSVQDLCLQARNKNQGNCGQVFLRDCRQEGMSNMTARIAENQC